jgi:hypothetical protein
MDPAAAWQPPDRYRGAQAVVAIPKGKSGKLIPNKALFGKLTKIAHRLDRYIQQGA